MDEILCEAENIKLYDALKEKHLLAIYSKRPNAVGEKLQKAREKFESLCVEDQGKVLYQIVQLSKIGLASADLTLIGESAHTGVALISKNIKQPEKINLIDQSVTGVYERKRAFTELEV